MVTSRASHPKLTAPAKRPSKPAQTAAAKKMILLAQKPAKGKKNG